VKKSLFYAFSVLFTTLLIHYFSHIEYFRANIEDPAFDLTNWFVFSKEEVDLHKPNTFLLLVDDKYLISKDLLDENNETKYGYIFPRNYLADIINDIDTLVEDLDEENYPKALFVDYDTSYVSDPHNKLMSKDDAKFLDILKKQRPYIIYLPLTSNYNYIYHSKDKVIQEKIKNGKIRFVSTGLTSSSDGISRRFYPYETYKDLQNEDRKFLHVAIELYNLQNPHNQLSADDFSLDKQAFIENRIIPKDMMLQEETPQYNYWQSKYKQLSAMSANYPLDNIYEESLQDAVLMIGAAHSSNSDTFEVDDYLREVSGIEMQANTLMTLEYFHGKLKQVPIYIELIIVFSIVFSIALLTTTYFGAFFEKLEKKIATIKNQTLKNFLEMLITDEDNRVLFFATGVFLFISYMLLKVDGGSHYWFNWMIPLLAYMPYKFLVWFESKIFKSNKRGKNVKKFIDRKCIGQYFKCCKCKGKKG